MMNKSNWLLFLGVSMACLPTLHPSSSDAQSVTGSFSDSSPIGMGSGNCDSAGICSVRLQEDRSARRELIQSFRFADQEPGQSQTFPVSQAAPSLNFADTSTPIRSVGHELNITDELADLSQPNGEAVKFQDPSPYLIEQPESPNTGSEHVDYRFDRVPVPPRQSVGAGVPPDLRKTTARSSNMLKPISASPSGSAASFRLKASKPLLPIQSDVQPDMRLTNLPAEVGVSEQLATEANRSTSLGLADDQEVALLKSFSVANLEGGIQNDSFRRATLKRVVADPNFQFLSSASYAPPRLSDDACVMWKTWESPNSRYRPLWFEEENLERYGHHAGQYLQPYVSGVHFFGSVITLPYKLASEGMVDCEYGLGYYRPGNCNPANRKRANISGRGLLLQTLTVGSILAL